MSASSTREAVNLIRSIRASRRVDDENDWNAADLSRSLEILSDQLYSTQTHYLFELVQNADDLDFEEGVIPKLVLIYRDDGYLWVGYNEIGFKEGDVNSICRLQLSTKGVRDGQRDHIGEKGIGFKSVFKVADKVWISSHPYHFRFDRDERLGMVIPIWDHDFPSNDLLNEQTMICLRIPRDNDQSAVDSHLRRLQAELPLFLRNIREIQVVFQNAQLRITDNYLVRREQSRIPTGDVVLMEKYFVRNTEDVKLRLMLEEFVAAPMPHEERRRNVSRSKLQMGFPISVLGLPDLANRDLYNFLPVRAYGLPFLLNGDFLLSASREEVLQGKQWNEALINAAVELFLKSVRRFNTENLLKYSWPRFTKSRGTSQGTALDALLPGIIQRLRLETVLESQAGTFERPENLTHVPSYFTEGNSPPVPLLVTNNNFRCFLATQYDYRDVSPLGVQQLSVQDFLADLRRHLQRNPNVIHAKSQEWHSRIAQAIRNKASWNDVQNIEIIPLGDGTWTSASRGTFYFPELGEGLEVPPRINISVIAQDAAEDPARRAMYQWLGGENLNISEVCRLVLDQYERFDPRWGWNREDVISHAWYLFRVSRTCTVQNPARLLFREQGTSHMLDARSLYLDLGEDFHVGEFFPEGSSLVRKLDPAYISKASPGLLSDWVEWLRGLGMWSIPRLSNSVFGGRRPLTPEFKCILERVPSQRFLQLLKTHWEIYRPYFSEDNRRELEEALVECLDGTRHKLKDVFLPRPPLLEEPFALNTLHFLDVAGDGESWKNLGDLGVGTRANFRFYTTILKRIKQKSYLQPSKEQVTHLYSKVQSIVERYPDSPRLNLQEAIFIPTDEPRWESVQNCVWSGPESFQHVPVLSRYYPDLALLFRSFLEIRDAQIGDVIEELLSLSGQVPRTHAIKDLLSSLNSLLRARANEDSIRRLHTAAVLPVRAASGELLLRTCESSASDWFVADRERLQLCFLPNLDFLDFTVSDVKRLLPLLQQLGLQDRFLSQNVTEATLTQGELEQNHSAQYMIRSKAGFMSRLVARNRREGMKQQLSHAGVFSTTNLVLRRTVRMSNGQEVHADDVGRVRVRAEENRISVFLNAEDIASGTLPWYQIKEELCRFFEIPQTKQVLVFGILTMNDESAIEDMLERNDISTDPEPAAHIEHDRFDHNASPQPMPTVRRELTPATPVSSEGAPRSVTPLSVYEALTPSSTPRSRMPRSQEATSFSTTNTVSLSPGPRRSSSRTSLSAPGTSTYYVIDPSRIEAAARTYRSERVVGVSAAEAEAEAEANGDLSLLALSTTQSSPLRAHRINRSPSPYNPSSSSFAFGEGHDSTFNFSAMASALPSSTPVRPSLQRPPITPGRSVSPSQSRSPGGGGCEQEIGSGGEFFIYKLLFNRFRISDYCWTSHSRSRYGLPIFSELERDYADFTVRDAHVVQGITNWLMLSGFTEADAWNGRELTYHFEVKTTTGSCEEPFMMSNNQLDLARRWHDSPNDVYIVLRVYDITSEPRFCAYVDPYAQMVARRLRFYARNGYEVRPD